MSKFTDTEGRDWLVAINVQSGKEVREKCNGLDLFDVGAKAGDTFLSLVTNPVILVDTLYVLCAKQADERDVSDEDFGRAMAGDAIEGATEAFVEALVNFTPNLRDRQRIQVAWEKAKKHMDRIRNQLDARLEDPATDAAIEAQLDAAMAKLWPDPSGTASGSASTNAPESSE